MKQAESGVSDGNVALDNIFAKINAAYSANNDGKELEKVEFDDNE